MKIILKTQVIHGSQKTKDKIHNRKDTYLALEFWRNSMRTDTVIRNEGMEILAKNLGMIEAERFIMLIQREPFDYTKWQENLFEHMTIEEISKNAAEYREKMEN